ncbi:unnamed protein product [Effrenium voratum]|nr:unnamed protein product [Effrenium voratum]
MAPVMAAASRPPVQKQHRRLGLLPLALLAGHAGLALSFLGNPFRTAGPPKAPVEEQSDPASKEEFSSADRQELLAELERNWQTLHQRLQEGIYPAVVDDPYFIVDPKGLLRRYLVAARFDVREAIIRLEATAKWRQEWNVLDYYRTGAAAELFSEEANPGAEMYFADSLLVDKEGRPYAAGRLKFANPENMHPWHHLRAGVMVFELMATKVAALGKGPASYILDISPPKQQGNVSGTAGLERNYNEARNPYYSRGAGKEAPSEAILEELGSLDNGFAVLKAAITILNQHYPGIVGRVFYLNSDMLFWGAFKIFSRWISDRGSIDFKFLGPNGWREEPLSRLLDHFDQSQLPAEWGGTGPSLNGDEFLARAIDRYESEAHHSELVGAS